MANNHNPRRQGPPQPREGKDTKKTAVLGRVLGGSVGSVVRVVRLGVGCWVSGVWFGGSVVRWFGGSEVRWFGGSVVRRFGGSVGSMGSVVRWFGGSVVRWFGGSVGSSGGSVQVRPQVRWVLVVGCWLLGGGQVGCWVRSSSSSPLGGGLPSPSSSSSSFSGGSPPPSPSVVVCSHSPLAAVHTPPPPIGRSLAPSVVNGKINTPPGRGVGLGEKTGRG